MRKRCRQRCWKKSRVAGWQRKHPWRNTTRAYRADAFATTSTSARSYSTWKTCTLCSLATSSLQSSLLQSKTSNLRNRSSPSSPLHRLLGPLYLLYQSLCPRVSTCTATSVPAKPCLWISSTIRSRQTSRRRPEFTSTPSCKACTRTSTR